MCPGGRCKSRFCATLCTYPTILYSNTVNKDLFDRIVNALLPDMDDPAARKALVESALFGSPALQKIQWDGAARPFTVRLVRQLDEFGEIAAGQPALAALLEELRDQIGADRQRQLDELVTALQTPPTSAAVALSAMPADHDLRIFLSYARKDGTAYCERLYNQLTAQQYLVWRDTRDLDPFTGFDAEIEQAIEKATHLVVIITPDVKRENSFVRLEIAYALMYRKRIIPLLFPGGHRPITIVNNTFIDFSDWDRAYGELLARLDGEVSESDQAPDTQALRRAHELRYLERIGQAYEQWLYLYTDLSGRAEKSRKLPQVNVKAHVRKYIDTTNSVYRERGYIEEGETRQVETVQELREVVRAGGVVLIGEPGSGKTTTLQRLAYEFAIAAIDHDAAPLPVFVPLGAYEGKGLEAYIASYFDELALTTYLPKRVVVLLDGLNEMPGQYVEHVDRWLRQNPGAVVVVTCRRLEYASLRALPLRRVDVDALDVNRIRLFISNYLEDDDCNRLFWALAGDPVADLWRLFQQHGLTFADFWQGENLSSSHPVYSSTSGNQDTVYNEMRAALREQGTLPGLLGLVTNPFLLRITVEVFIETGQPPRNRGQLFSAFVDLLIEQRGYPAASAQHPWIKADEQIRALAGLAYRMQAEQTGTSISLDWAQQTLRSDSVVADPTNLLYLAESATLITVDSVKGELRFFHQLMQEYFAARKMADEVEQGVTAARYWPGDWWKPTGWEETAVLVAGMRPDVAEWLLDANPLLACRALLEGQASPAAVLLVRERMVQVIAGSAPARARADAARMLNRIGDNRPGVGLRPDGLPDIVWCEAIPPDIYPIGGDDQAYSSLPAEKYQLQYSYQIARYPITNGQFQVFIDAGATGYNNPAYWTKAGLAWKGERTAPDEFGDMNFRLPNHPRIYVTWYEAMAFCAWLTEQQRRVGLIGMDAVIRLPQEKEWEIAARGAAGLFYPYGNDFNTEKGNTYETGIGQTSAVGLFLPGAAWCGAQDMSGNVWEWCLNPYDEPENGLRPEHIHSDARRVLRGGSWIDSGDDARAASRFRLNPFYRYVNYGFRVCRPPSL